MTSKEVYKFSKVLEDVVNRRQDGKEDSELYRHLRTLTRKMCQKGIITHGQRDWLNGQILKETDRCNTGFYIPMLREFK